MARLELSEITKEPHKLGWLLGKTRLSEIHSRWMRYLFASKGDVSLQAHRNSYKTTTICIGVIWFLIYNPNARVLILRKTDDMATDVVQTIRKLYEGPELAAIYATIGIKQIRTNVWTQSQFSLSTKRTVTPEPNVSGKGITGNLTGQHYDLILPDDIVTEKDRYSKAEREFTKRVVRELTNIKDIHIGRIASTGTVWHKEDAWSLMPEPQRYTIYDNPLNLSKERIAQLRAESSSASLWAANYELKHIADEGRIFAEPNKGPWPNADCIGYVDTAYGGGNFVALTLACKVGENIHLRGWVWPQSVTTLYAVIAEIMKKHRGGTLWVETNADKALSIGDDSHGFRKFWPLVQGVTVRVNKHVRIMDGLHTRWGRLIFALDAQPEWLNQILDYAEGQEPDDAPDSAAGAVKVLEGGNVKITQLW